MENRFFTLWKSEGGLDPQPLVDQLTGPLLEQKKTCLVVHLRDEKSTPASRHSPAQDPAIWVPRFESLSPALVRNFLASQTGPSAQLILEQLPPSAVLTGLLRLLRKTFEWIFWIAPVDWSPESIAVLDASDLLLWIVNASPMSEENLKAAWEKLASLHFANAFSQLVLLDSSPAVPGEPLQNLPPVAGRTPLVRLPLANPRHPAFRQEAQRLLGLLQCSENFFPHKEAVVKEEAAMSAADVVETIKNRIQPQLLQAIQQGDAPLKGQPPLAPDVAQKTLETYLAQDITVAASRDEREQIYHQVLDAVLGLGPIEPLLKDPEISEVMVNGKDCIFVEKKGKLHPVDVQFSSEQQLRTIIDRIVAPIGRRVDESMPLCDARLADGSRVNIVLPPLALDGAVITIRKFMAKALGFADLVRLGSLTAEMAEFLRACVRLHKNIVVSGGTGSGKTTLLNALSGMIQDDERIVTIEDAAELRLQKPHVVRLESRPPNVEGEGAIPIRRLVINALRMRPDRIVVGECRGGEALDMLQAMNTGHDGSLTTLHANTPRDALSRMETLVLMAGMDLPVRVVREQIRSAIDIIVQQSRLSDGARKVTSITEVTGMEGETLTTQELFRFRQTGRDASGRIQGSFENTGIVPSFSQDMKALLAHG